MKMMLPTAFLASVTLLATAGCKQADRAVSAPPTRAELPSFAELEPTLSIVVGVEGLGVAPRVLIVPKYEEIVLTPEEHEALGHKELPEPDVLLFYRPPRGPEDGVLPGSFQPLTGIGGVGGAQVGYASVDQRYGSYGFAGRHAYPHALVRSGAKVGPARTGTAEVGRGWLMQVGECLPRTGARRASRADR